MTNYSLNYSAAKVEPPVKYVEDSKQLAEIKMKIFEMSAELCKTPNIRMLGGCPFNCIFQTFQTLKQN